jgi:hypothetical protein
MKRYLQLLILSCCYSGSFSLLDAQTPPIKQDVISSAGTRFQSSTTALDWTLGEISVSTLQGNSAVLSQGFHQPKYLGVENWSVDPTKFSFDGEIAGQVFIDDIPVTSGNGILGAFVGEECRGVKTGGLTSPSGKYVFVLRCYSNSSSGETLSFKYYYPIEEIIYSIIETVNFESNMIVGDATNPFEFNVSTGVQINKPLSLGWTWFSLNLTSSDMSTNTVLSSLNAKDGDYIKNQTVSATYYNGVGWFGELTKIDPKDTYKIKLGSATTLSFTGVPIDLNTQSILIMNGWNWIGYLPQTAQSITNALSSINPVSFDYIKNQTKSSTFYEGAGWFGELNTIDPLDGFMLKTSHTGTLLYSHSFPNARGFIYRTVQTSE